VKALLDGEAEALTRKAIERALEGDTTALRLCLDGFFRRARTVPFPLPFRRSRAPPMRVRRAQRF
jgi:hypothetical protein